jgi:uncharacterized membrane protein YeaQ/YmgE (transglycosylase-associated protein family)
MAAGDQRSYNHRLHARCGMLVGHAAVPVPDVTHGSSVFGLGLTGIGSDRDGSAALAVHGWSGGALLVGALVVAAVIGFIARQLARRGLLLPALLGGVAAPSAAYLLGPRPGWPQAVVVLALLALVGAAVGALLWRGYRRLVPAVPAAIPPRLVVAATAGNDPSLDALFHRLAVAPDAGLALEAELGAWFAWRFPPSAGYVVLNGVDRGRGDIDHIVIGPGGVWVLETKFWRGGHRFTNDAQQSWIRYEHPRPFSHPHAQLVDNCAWLEQLVARRLPNLLEAYPLPVNGLLVWAHPRSTVWVDDGVRHWPIVRPVEAAAIIAAASADVLTAAQVTRLATLLQSRARGG